MNTHRSLAILALSACLAAMSSPLLRAEVHPVDHYRDLRYPPLQPVQLPSVQRAELPNGLVVFLAENRELPVIHVCVRIRVGSRWEPLEKAGLAEMVGGVMRTGGSASWSGDRLDKELDRLGAELQVDISAPEMGQADLVVAKEGIDDGLSILSDLLRHPVFPEDRIEQAKTSKRGEILRRNEALAEVAWAEFERVIFGKDSPYAHQPELATINSIRRDDLVGFHHEFFHPGNMILGVWGDFETEEMRTRIEKAFGIWPRCDRPRPQVPPVDSSAAERAGIYLIDNANAAESLVFVGHLGGTLDDPDCPALDVMNTILGEGRSGRLWTRVRNEGWSYRSYSVASNWYAGWDHPGIFIAYGETKADNTLRLLRTIHQEVVRMTQEEVSEEELTGARDGMQKRFPFEFDSTGKLIGRVMTYEDCGYPRDHLQRYQEGIAKVTRADVLRVAKHHLRPDRFVIVVLGNEKKFEQPLSTLGPVTQIDVTIPKP